MYIYMRIDVNFQKLKKWKIVWIKHKKNKKAHKIIKS